MDKERNEEQEFLKDVDQFLNGEEVTPDESASEDTRSAIEFARKLTEFRAEPSPEFQERLKSKLLRKLTEREVAAREKTRAIWLHDFVDKLIPQSPVWRTAVVTVAIVMVATGVMWRTGLFTPTAAPGEGEANGRTLEESAPDDAQKWDGLAAAGEQEEEAPPPIITAPGVEAEEGMDTFGGGLRLEIEVSPSETAASLIGTRFQAPYGSEVTLTLAFTNTSSEPVTVDISQVSITGGSEVGTVYIFPAVDGPIELTPFEPFQVLFVWGQQDSSGAQVAPGVYTFNAGTITVTRGTDSFEILPPPAEVVVLEP
jgi:hypothetical protein